MRKILVLTAAMTLGSILLGSSARANLYVYPSKGQSKQQQEMDEIQCHQWAQQQTGVDPAKIAEQSTSLEAYKQPEDGMAKSLLGGGAIGAALGAIVGGIAGDPGEGAAIGSAVGGAGGFFHHRQKMEEQHQYNEYVAGKQRTAMNQYEQAYKTCLRGRGYTLG